MQSAYPVRDSIPTSPWLVFPKPNPEADVRLFCFPYAGAGAVVYHPWPGDLPAGVEVIAVRYPGRETRMRELPYTRLDDLLDGLLPHLLPYLDRSFAFFGHSMGGMIAFELARRLRRQGHAQPEHLFVSSRRPLHLPEPYAPLHHLDDAAFLDGVQQRYNGVPPVILQDPELLGLFLPMMKADFSILETYQFTIEEPFDFPVTAFLGEQDPSIAKQEMASWQMHSHRKVPVQVFAGDHFYLHSQRAALLHAIAARLKET